MKKYANSAAVAILMISGFCGAIVGVRYILKYPVAKQITLIQSKDIPKSVQIVGTLGEPLGHLLLIRGTWIAAGHVGKGGEPDLQVTEVNGRVLARSVLLPSTLISQFLPNHTGGKSDDAEVWDWREGEGDDLPPIPIPGETWELLGIQTGQFSDKSPEAVKEFTGVPTQRPFFLSGLVTPFEYIAMRKL